MDLKTVCVASDSGLTIAKCWCAQCKDDRKENKKMVKRMTRASYLNLRKYYRDIAFQAIKDGNTMDADFYTGIVKGLDLAFNNATASIHTIITE